MTMLVERPTWQPYLCESCGKRILDVDPRERTRVRVKCHHRDPATGQTCNAIQVVKVEPGQDGRG